MDDSLISPGGHRTWGAGGSSHRWPDSRRSPRRRGCSPFGIETARRLFLTGDWDITPCGIRGETTRSRYLGSFSWDRRAHEGGWGGFLCLLIGPVSLS
ncbi:hypothetical protein GQ53DRAFT_423895 [Thozetella sp. PMI_491]|nr:hypothetical protein GQ53DRAFT_423895 [Thozetella sp. PMI_491]